MRINHENTARSKGNLKLFLLIFLLLGTLGGGILTFFYQSHLDDFFHNLKREEFRAIERQRHIISDVFSYLANDLLFLTGQNELHALQRENNLNISTAIANEYIALLTRKKAYDQIRFLDKRGWEIIRVNNQYRHPISVDRSFLQNKSKRYYFSETIKLQQGEVFISPMDLNVEHGEIEQPFKPMIRFGTPFYDAAGTKHGIVLINYLAQPLLDTIRHASDTSLGIPLLLNNKGYWLLADTPEDEWGFMIKDRADRSFARDYPTEWSKILSEQSGHLYTSNGVFTFDKVYPIRERQLSNVSLSKSHPLRTAPSESLQYFWVLLSYIPPDLINKRIHSLQIEFLILGAGLFTIIAVGAFLLAQAISHRHIYHNHLLNMALYDPLTGLPNRKLFFDNLKTTLALTKRYQRRFGVLFIDLDEFKNVNDTMGHDSGDELLIKVGETIQTSLRKSDTVARLGGDEFGIILPELNELNDALLIGNKIILALQSPITLNAGKVCIGASIGAAVYPNTSIDADALIKAADQAMYQSKTKGKNICTMANQPT